MAVRDTRIRLDLLFLICALCAAVIMGPAVAGASASVNAFASASDCTGSSCSNFRITVWGSTIRPNSSAKVCFKGRCVTSQSNSEGVVFADFNGVGPYRNGSKTSTRVTYKGRSYNRNVWIACGC